MGAFEICQTVPWAITPEGLQAILTIANREGSDAMLDRALARREARHQAVAAQAGRPLDDTRTVTMRDGIAIMAITGPIMRYADIFSEISGATSVQALARDFNRVVKDPAVNGIVLSIDSPGGEVNGIQEFAAMVYAARGQKPITAYVGDLGASAAYWIASAADEVIVAPTSLVGSIGVVAAVRDPSKTNAKDIEFVSSQSPKKRADPTTESGRTQLQTIVDDIAAVFVASVALHRGISEAKVVADYGQGGVFVGRAAVAAGLADRLGSFEQVLTEARTPKTIGRISAAQQIAFKEAERARAEAVELEQVRAKARAWATRSGLNGRGAVVQAVPVAAPQVRVSSGDAEVDAARAQGRAYAERMNRAKKR